MNQRSPAPFKSGLQRGEVVARGYRVGMVRPEARLENRERAAHQRLGFGEAARGQKEQRKIVEVDRHFGMIRAIARLVDRQRTAMSGSASTRRLLV